MGTARRVFALAAAFVVLTYLVNGASSGVDYFARYFSLCTVIGLYTAGPPPDGAALGGGSPSTRDALASAGGCTAIGRAPRRLRHGVARMQNTAGTHMSWDAVGAIAELLGAIGVIASLGYLAQQVRHNTRSVRAASYQSWFASYDSLSNLLLGDLGFDALLHRAASEPQNLTPDERRRFSGVLRRGFRQFESLYYQHREGMIDRDLFEAWVAIYSRSATGPIFKQFWEADQSIFSAAFRDFIATRFPA